ncbi:MAG: 50S ribosomal protein L21 [Patescibacteria group bacterium]|nr:50S ribosomal protein L21 [Patescibacteria group bacterium]
MVVKKITKEKKTVKEKKEGEKKEEFLRAVIKTGGKEYLVKQGDEIIVDYLGKEPKTKVEFATLAIFDEKGERLDLGKPELEKKVKGEIVENFKGKKIRVAKFKAKVRYRRVKGFRQILTKVRIGEIN